MMYPQTYHVVNGLFVRDMRLLLFKKRKDNGPFWIPPGGKIDPGEDHKTCLAREFSEEQQGAKLNTDVWNYDIHHEGQSPIEGAPNGDVLNIAVFPYETDFDGEIEAVRGEIEDWVWMPYSPENRMITPVTHQIMNRLHTRGLL